MKTSEEILNKAAQESEYNPKCNYSEYVHWNDGMHLPDVIKAMKEYARQALEEYRDDLLRELPQTFSKSDPVKYRYKIGQYIMDADIKQFIK